MINLEDRVAIITGGAKGIGRATVLLFLELGARVAIWDVDNEAGIALASRKEGKEGRLAFFPVDTSDSTAVEEAVREVMQAFGHIDILVNNAGITRDASLKKMSLDHWQQVIDVNLTGLFLCTRAVVPYLEARGRGRILNAASVVAHHGNFGQTNYVAAKAGVIGMTKVWAREFGRKGITVNAVAPGFIQTDMVGTIPEEIVEQLQVKTPLERFGTPEDVAWAYAFLASDAAAFITGATLNVDGGLIM